MYPEDVVVMEYIPPDHRIKNNSDLPSSLFKGKDAIKWFGVCMAGIIIIFIGSLWVTYAMWTPIPNANDYSNTHDYKEALNNWKNATESGNLYGRVTIEIGAMVVIAGSFMGYIDSAVDDTDKRRLLILLLVGLIILIIVSVGIIEQSPYA